MPPFHGLVAFVAGLDIRAQNLRLLDGGVDLREFHGKCRLPSSGSTWQGLYLIVLAGHGERKK